MLTEICRKPASMPAAFFAAIDAAAGQGQAAHNTQELIDRGGFGSPTIFVGGDDMYFGNDRMPLIRDAVLRRRKHEPDPVAVDDRGEAGPSRASPWITRHNATRSAMPASGNWRRRSNRPPPIRGLRVIVLTGAGDRSFIGGANITEMSGFRATTPRSKGPT